MKDNKPLAVLFMCLSTLGFSMMGVMIKLSGDIPVFEKVFFRNLISLVIAYITIIKTKEKIPAFGRKENRFFLLFRSLLGLAGMSLYFYSINNMYLADSTMLNKISPFFVTLFAWFFLKEKLSKFQLPALALIFTASLLIIKPKFDSSILPALACFLSAITSGGAYTIIRYLKNKEHPATIIFYFSLVSVAGLLPLVAFNFVIPTPTQLIYLLLTGVFAGMGQFGLTYAYKLSPASEVSIYNYLSIVFSALFGFVFWREIPDIYSIAGGTIIIATAVAVFMYNNAYFPNFKLKFKKSG